MFAQESYLSDARYGYDFVVSTAQESINASLKQFLNQGNHKPLSLCFLADEAGRPSVQKSLDEVLRLTQGVNPFDIPAGTPSDDSRVKALSEARFQVGLQIQLGLPSQVDIKSLPPVVGLQTGARRVQFNLLCSQLTVIQNTSPAGSASTGCWDVWSQPKTEAWYFTTMVDLVMADLDKELDTPYFNNHPAIKAQLKRQLQNMGQSAFSLRQLFFDLDNAALQATPDIKGLPRGSKAASVLRDTFVSVYSAAAREKGLPLLGVTVVPDGADPSPLQLTASEHQVSLFKGIDGLEVRNPTRQQQDAATLDYLCATSHNKLPPATAFTWNWVPLEDLASQSGTIAINRNAIARFLIPSLVTAAKMSCFKFKCYVTAHVEIIEYDLTYKGLQNPDNVTVTSKGPDVIHIDYKSEDETHDWCFLNYGSLRVKSTYACDVTFSGTTITLKQHVAFHAYAQVEFLSIDGSNLVDKTVTTEYAISVDQAGGLRMKHLDTKVKDNSKSIDDNFWLRQVRLTALLEHLKFKGIHVVDNAVNEATLNSIPKFIFPGSRVFAYKSAEFSKNQDLVCAITYVDPRGMTAGNQAPLPEQSAGTTETASTDLALPTTGSCLGLMHQSELMQNYLAGEVVSPTGKFAALQTADGLGMLFALSTSGALEVMTEVSGRQRTGWQVSDLSKALVAEQLPGRKATVSTFDVRQSAINGTISLAMAVSVEGSDRLFISLNNDGRDTSWMSCPEWVHVPFDAAGPPPAAVGVAGALFAETSDRKELLIVDIDRAGSEATTKHIVRYRIDLAKASGHFWVKQDVPVDIEHGTYQSCIGRSAQTRVDGVYTAGSTAGAAQLVYVPIVNVFGDGPPPPVRLALPEDAPASAIAAARQGDKSSPHLASTDLYAVSGSTLFRFAAAEQHDGARGAPLVSDGCLSLTDTLHAMTHGGVTTVWGKNGSGQVYYLSCTAGQEAVPGAWSHPVPILTDMERISAYVNCVDGGNTIFASGGGKLVRLTQATDTEAQLWRPHAIVVDSGRGLPALPLKSYTTTLHVINSAAQDMPVADTPVSIAAESRTPVYINGIYYVLGQKPISIRTDHAGSLTVIEATDGLHAATLTVSIPNGLETHVIDPKAVPFEKIAALDSADRLRNADFPATTIAGGVSGHVERRPLVQPSTPEESLDAVAAGMVNLHQIYSKVRLPAATTTLLPLRDRGCGPHVVPRSLYGIGHGDPVSDIAISIGNLFRWLRSGVEALVEIIKDALTDAWHFIAKIAGKVYRAVLNTVDAVVGAVEWVFHAIKTNIADLVRFAEFLFEWDDIRRTKDVLHNIVKLFLGHQIQTGLETAKTCFDHTISEAEKAINNWANIADWPSLGPAASLPAKSSASSPAKGQTPASLLLSNHFGTHVRELTIVTEPPAVDHMQVGHLIDVLLAALSREGQVLSNVYLRLKELAEVFHTMTVAEAVKAFAATLADGLLSSVQVVFDALVDALRSLVGSAVELLDTKIHIPVISDLLNLLGVPDVSILDLFAWISAVSYTVVYKAVCKQAPFANTAKVRKLISAVTWDELTAVIDGNSGRQLALSEQVDEETEDHQELVENIKKAIFTTCHCVAGTILITGNFLSVLEAEAITGDNPFGIPAAVANITAATLQGAANFLVPVCPIKNQVFVDLSRATLVASLAVTIIFCGPVQKRLAVTESSFKGLAVGDGRATGSIFDAILVIPALVTTSWHFHELSHEKGSGERSAAIVGEVYNLATYVSRLSYTAAVNLDPADKQIPLGVLAVSNLTRSGLQIAEGLIEI
ncbi:gamma-glutamyltranspeptidase periplasmic precursor [Hirsutella rhossiliensis]|uniref:Gamma-glutamyltranspeptidase periplasmic n=1 Tax=Hirsutella rhossiliensis TaxID=111463 RepID=A0A9P8SK42_9HYPO|nr:gamma-glutamyltranspeptidase periplasmic precursor [Hirsutella rhossiliensis]KAH0963726.1 gamma-glutamyltranspeptidase periplasmic precursor [Hirsutella rhossiliensis]